jgi:hypothetical protein
VKRSHLHLLAVAAAGISCSEGDPSSPVNRGVDTTPPEQIVAPALSYPAPGGDAVLAWTAPVDDGGRVARYDIRYGYSLPLNWDLAIAAPDPPAPVDPGGAQTWSLSAPLRGRDLYAAIRSFDESGNGSTVSEVAFVHISGYRLNAQCLDTMTRSPLEGLAATVTSHRVHELTTDAQGVFSQGDLAGGTVNVAVRNPESPPTLYHNINDPFLLDDDTDRFYHLIPYQPAASAHIDNALELLRGAATGLGTGTVLRKWNTLPVDVHVPPFTNNGIDFEAKTLEAIDRWELRTGVDLFRLVPTAPAEGIEVRFLPRSEMGIQNGITVHFDDDERFPVRDVVKILDEFNNETKLYQVMLHEFGHTIRLNHLPAGFIMFAGQPLPNDISDDEVLVVQLHSALPNATNLGIYQVTSPAE